MSALRYHVLSMEGMKLKNCISWDITPCSSLKVSPFFMKENVTYCFRDEVNAK
jgi:hypothetical protein